LGGYVLHARNQFHVFRESKQLEGASVVFVEKALVLAVGAVECYLVAE
jgi:hypothetical protein